MTLDHELRGGQLWCQLNFPYCQRLVVLLGVDEWIMMSDPMEHEGCMAASANDGQVVFTAQELLAHFRAYNYTNTGQYSPQKHDELYRAYSRAAV